jgi:hypothetical protein
MKFQAETNKPVYVTVTEQWYGGFNTANRPSPIRVFTIKEDALAFAASYGTKYNVDVIVIKSAECSLSDITQDGTFIESSDEITTPHWCIPKNFEQRSKT